MTFFCVWVGTIYTSQLQLPLPGLFFCLYLHNSDRFILSTPPYINRMTNAEILTA